MARQVGRLSFWSDIIIANLYEETVERPPYGPFELNARELKQVKTFLFSEGLVPNLLSKCCYTILHQ